MPSDEEQGDPDHPDLRRHDHGRPHRRGHRGPLRRVHHRGGRAARSSTSFSQHLPGDHAARHDHRVRRAARGERHQRLHHRPDHACRGFINVAGIQSPGLTASPAIAELVREHPRATRGWSSSEKADFRRPRARGAALRRGEPGGAAARWSAQDPPLRPRGLPLRAGHRGRDRTTPSIAARAPSTASSSAPAPAWAAARAAFAPRAAWTCSPQRAGVPCPQITKRGGGSWLVTEMRNAQHPRTARRRAEEVPHARARRRQTTTW